MMDPQAKAVLDELRASAKPMPSDERAWLRGYRAELDEIVAMQGPRPACAVLERRVPDPAGGEIGLRLYQPDDAAGPRPTLLFIHGGGFVAGSLEGYDIPLRHLALRSDWRIAAVDYGLAPEHPFPTAPDQCMTALRALLDDASVDEGRVAVGGDSAGGLLATVVARRARDAGLPLALQVMLYPNTDLREATPHASRRAHDGVVVRLDELERSVALYCGAAERTDSDVSPLLAEDLGGLCPALLITCEHDPLRDEAEAYGRRLRAAGVNIKMERLDGMIHSVFQRGGRIAAGDALITRVADALRSCVTAAAPSGAKLG